MQEEREFFWAAFKWMEMVRNEKGQSCWNCQTAVDTVFWGSEWKRKDDFPVIDRKQLASYFSYDFQILKVKGLLFTEEN